RWDDRLGCCACSSERSPGRAPSFEHTSNGSRPDHRRVQPRAETTRKCPSRIGRVCETSTVTASDRRESPSSGALLLPRSSARLAVRATAVWYKGCHLGCGRRNKRSRSPLWLWRESAAVLAPAAIWIAPAARRD